MKEIMHYMKGLYQFSGKVWYLNLFGMIVVSFLEGIGLFLLIPILSISGIIDNPTYRFVSLDGFTMLKRLSPTVILVIALCVFIFVAVMQGVLQRTLNVFTVKFQHRYIQKLRTSLYDLLLHASWRFFISKRKSDLTNALTVELARVNAGVGLVMQLLTAVIFTLIQIVLAFVIAPTITVFVLCSGAVLAVFSRKFIKKSKALGARSSRIAQDYLAGITDQLSGMKDIKVNHLEKDRLRWLREINERMVEEQVEYTKIRSNSQFFYTVSSTVFIALFIFLSLQLFHGQTTQLLLVVVIFSRLWPRFTGIQSNIQQLASYAPAFQFIRQLELECEEASEKQDSQENKRLAIEEGITCSDVSFRYLSEKETYALRHINVTIPANQMTAIVGPSGAGKSTLIDLFTGLHRPESGHVLVDGRDLESGILYDLRHSVSYVPQDPFLFNESIRDNLKIVKQDATEEELWEALEIAECASFVANSPDGLDTMIGDRGMKLSGGERQRLVLARAILKKPSLLILDEATSALDSNNEAKIQEAIERMKGSMTIVVIAHRLSTITHADQVIVVERGCIVQNGKYAQLAQDETGMFHELLQKQVSTPK
ncbi:ABC transporter [Fictibacillus macauensis ZFHKF-1]|uniref:ABC transporter n=1 Tax=Fictibacillus macauensis ZFHKF-1 TaxID=1196324 RepID=I8UI14_9BACL|nr:ABC transporter ATP-binding protein [Fictibacillus macauensis]EIT86525.1 ABC transporter [Fictibacillus macauensis ZFHKF-1]